MCPDAVADAVKAIELDKTDYRSFMRKGLIKFRMFLGLFAFF